MLYAGAQAACSFDHAYKPHDAEPAAPSVPPLLSSIYDRLTKIAASLDITDSELRDLNGRVFGHGPENAQSDGRAASPASAEHALYDVVSRLDDRANSLARRVNDLNTRL
jgi:hypothetical protein